jgi:hypothetical protein
MKGDISVLTDFTIPLLMTTKPSADMTGGFIDTI